MRLHEDEIVVHPPTAQAQAELQQWLGDNEFVGLSALTDSKGTVGDGAANIPALVRLLRLTDLQDGGRYAAVPTRRSLGKLRLQVTNLDNNQENLARQREGEVEQALTKYAPQLLGVSPEECKVTAVSPPGCWVK